MNRAMLNELQRQRCYPSITVLLNTTPGGSLAPLDLDTLMRLSAIVDTRLEGDVSDALRRDLLARLAGIITEQAGERCTQALALFISPEHTAAVRLGRTVVERVIIDDTFATRDLVADLNRTALYRVIAISERTTRHFIGDRQRLIEQRDETWPLLRADTHTPAMWARAIDHGVRAEQATDPLPTVLAGVERSVRRLAPDLTNSIGVIPGNHDRTRASDLHHSAWPLVTDWLRTDGNRAMQQLDTARSVNRYAGGIHEIWPLAHDGRIATLVVENSYTLPARVDANNQLDPADDPDHPDVNDDVVDDVIESVLGRGGTVVIVNDGILSDHQRIAAVLRY